LEPLYQGGLKGRSIGLRLRAAFKYGGAVDDSMKRSGTQRRSVWERPAAVARQWIRAEPTAPLLALALLAFLIDLGMTSRSGSIDLRNRVVGARLLLAGRDAYKYHWEEGDPERWADPSDVLPEGETRFTAAPSVHAAYIPVAWMPYPYIRYLWLMVQWVSLVLLGWLMARAAADSASRFAVWFSLVALFALGDAWRLHVERGQVYVIFALLLACAYSAGRQETRKAGILCGAILGAAAVFRPTLGLGLLPMAAARRWRTVVAGVLAGCLVFAAMLPLVGPNDWRSYFAAMERMARSTSGEVAAPTRVRPRFPPVIEGSRNVGRTVGRFAWSNSAVLHVWGVVCGGTAARRWSVRVALAVILVAWPGALAAVWRKKPPTFDALFLMAVTFAAVSEFFAASTRNSYNNLLWFVPVAIWIKQRKGWPAFRGFSGAWLVVSIALANAVLPGGILDHHALEIGGRAGLVLAGDYMLAAFFVAAPLLVGTREEPR